MNKLFEFIKKYAHSALFVLFQIFSFVLIVVFNPFQQAKFNSLFLGVTGTINGWSQSVYDYFNLANENEQLVANFSDSTTVFNNLNQIVFMTDTFEVNSTEYKSNFKLYPAKVVYNSVHKKNNIFVINRGSKDGIKKSMGVMSPSGVAGIVIHVTSNYSTVMSLLNSSFKLVPQINESEYYSSVEWNRTKPEYLIINGVNKQEVLEKGMQVTTGKSSIIFPEGLPIGTIKKLNKKPSSQYYNILVTPSTDFRRLGTVFVLEKKDIDELNIHLGTE